MMLVPIVTVVMLHIPLIWCCDVGTYSYCYDVTRIYCVTLVLTVTPVMLHIFSV